MPNLVSCRFEDLPVAQMRTSHKDPEVAAGLAAIAKLDEELREASLKVCKICPSALAGQGGGQAAVWHIRCSPLLVSVGYRQHEAAGS